MSQFDEIIYVVEKQFKLSNRLVYRSHVPFYFQNHIKLYVCQMCQLDEWSETSLYRFKLSRFNPWLHLSITFVTFQSFHTSNRLLSIWEWNGRRLWQSERCQNRSYVSTKDIHDRLNVLTTPENCLVWKMHQIFASFFHISVYFHWRSHRYIKIMLNSPISRRYLPPFRVRWIERNNGSVEI